MGTHPIFESDFDCLTDLYLRFVYYWNERTLKGSKMSNKVDTNVTNREIDEAEEEDNFDCGAINSQFAQPKLKMAISKPVKQNERRGTGFVFDTAGKENIEAQKANLLKKFNEINEEKIEENQNDQKS